MPTTTNAPALKAGVQQTLVQPYLFFGGKCEEALKFYEHAIGAKVETMVRYNESPSPIPEGMLEPGFEKKVMHAQFNVGGSTLMASDGCNSKSLFSGFSLSISVQTEKDASRVFSALSEGGKVTMPLAKTFWSPQFGMLQDKFGVDWMVSMPDPQYS